VGRKINKPRSPSGSLITIRRIEKRLSTQAVAKACGITATTLNRWETGKVPGYGSVYKLAKLLDISLDDLLKP
jgi:transcriptional regulator with XRE-family HTH domain